GQGAQYPGMGQELYNRFESYRNAVDTCSDILNEVLHEDIRKIIFSDNVNKLRETYYTQPAIFVTEYALAKLWMSWGVEPTAFIGHSVGEFVGACLAGVFSLSDALSLIASRGRLVNSLPRGSMLSVRESVDIIASTLPKGLSIAANNAPRLCVVSGPHELIAAYRQHLTQIGVTTSLLHTSHAFHSSMMDPILEAFNRMVSSVEKHVPNKPIISTVTGSWLTDEQALSAEYWVHHVRETVNFSEAMLFANKTLGGVFMEMGPGNVTATLAKQHLSTRASRVIGGIQKSDTTSELSVLFEALGKVWSLGLSPDWRAVFGSYTPLSDLPSFAYERRYHWLSPPCDENPNGSASNSFEKPSHKVNDTRMRKQLLINKVRDILDQASGITIEDHAIHDNFVEMGFDSLLLTQIAQALKKEFNVPITFRKLNEECSSLERLADFLDQHLPMDQFSLETLSKANSTTVPPLTGNHPPIDAINTATPGTADSMVLLSQQISLL